MENQNQINPEQEVKIEAQDSTPVNETVGQEEKTEASVEVLTEDPKPEVSNEVVEENTEVVSEEKQEATEAEVPTNTDEQAELTSSVINEEDEDVDDEEEEEVEDTTNYDELSPEELLVAIETLVAEKEVTRIKSSVGRIKLSFETQVKAIKEEMYAKLLEAAEEGQKVDRPKLEIEAKFRKAFQDYRQKKFAYIEELEKQKQANLVKRNEILDKLRELLKTDDSLKETYDKFNVLQQEWREIGMVPKSEIDELWKNYHFLIDKFFEKVQINKELRDMGMQKNLEEKIELADKAEELLLESSVNKSFKKLQEYHTKWKEIGPAPKDKEEELWERFKAATNKINDRRKEFYDEIRDQQKNNLILKTALCEKSELLLAEFKSIKEWQEKTDEMKQLFEEWRKLGPVPKTHNEDVWDRFKKNMNQFYKNKQQYFDHLKEEQTENYNRKLELCKQAEALQESQDWKATTEELIRLQKEWKSVGAVARKQSDKIWKRFRAANDAFFENKDKHFKSMKAGEDDNFKLKKELMEKMAAFEFGDDNKANLEQIKAFQKEWLEIGRVPRNKHRDLQNDYRSLVDGLFEKLSINRAELDNLQMKNRLENAGDEKEQRFVLRKEKNFVKGKMDQIKQDINQLENNMGFFANSKNADVLKIELEKKIEKARKEFKVLQAKYRFLDKSEKELGEKTAE
jgi:hypothetical protein